MNRGKGSGFEREISKLLSRWWSKGLGQPEREDIFWRSSQSGGRATQRRKKGKDTFGSYGDIAAVDPIGAPLIEMFTIELKRGDSHGCPFELIECEQSKVMKSWERVLMQTVLAHQSAGSKSWLLIHKKDRKQTMVYLPSEWAKKLKLFKYPCCRFGFSILFEYEAARTKISETRIPFDVAGMTLEDFLKRLTPKQIIECAVAKE